MNSTNKKELKTEKKALAHVLQEVFYEDGKRNTVIYFIEKIQHEDGTIEKVLRQQNNPKYTYYVANDLNKFVRPLNYTVLSDVHPVTCKYDDLFESIASSTNQIKYYNSVLKLEPRDKFFALNSLHKSYSLFAADLNLIDYKIYEWKQNNQNTIMPITKAFYDIEVDIYDYDGFPNPEEAPCPINFISYILDSNKEMYSFILLNPDNESQAEFLDKYKNTPDFLECVAKEIGVPKIHLKVFKSEFKLIVSFLQLIKRDKPDFAGAWNAAFDLLTIKNRLMQLDPDTALESFFCPNEFEHAHVRINEDTRATNFQSKKSTFDITGYTQFICLLESFANIRASMQKREDYKLDSILFEELGESKYSYDGDIKDAAYINYESFWMYSLFDSFRLLQLEEKNKDVNLLNDMSFLTNTRFGKVMSKTTSIRNFAYELLLTDGFILANNHNKFIKHENKKFKGAFVATPDGIDRIGVKLFDGIRSNRIFSNVVDEDLEALYPSIIVSNNIDSDTLIGKIQFPDDIELETNFPMLISENDLVRIGHSLLGLPNVEEAIKEYLIE